MVAAVNAPTSGNHTYDDFKVNSELRLLLPAARLKRVN